MITSSGAICDVCGEYILPLDPDELVNAFSVKGIKETLHCDNKCKELLLSIGKEWQLLPIKGRLYQAFLEASK
jgi:hypothetical protein